MFNALTWKKAGKPKNVDEIVVSMSCVRYYIYVLTDYPRTWLFSYFSEWGWSDCAGMAYVFGMCGGVSSGVNRVSHRSFLTIKHPTPKREKRILTFIIERFSIECRKTKTKVITSTNHSRRK